MKVSEVAKLVSQAWKSLPDSQRFHWQEMARRDRERFEREKAAYTGPWKVPNVKDPNAPKKPMSAFLAFGNQRRKAVAAANPSLSCTEVSSFLSQLWKACPVGVKQAYRDDEARKREIYKQKRAEWKQRQKLESLNDTIFESDFNDVPACNHKIVASSTATVPSHFKSTDTVARNATSVSFATHPLEAPEDALNPLAWQANQFLASSQVPIDNTENHSFVDMESVNANTAWLSLLEPRRVAFGVGNVPVGFESETPQHLMTFTCALPSQAEPPRPLEHFSSKNSFHNESFFPLGDKWKGLW